VRVAPPPPDAHTPARWHPRTAPRAAFRETFPTAVTSRSLEPLRRASDFQRALSSRPCAKSHHFALHHGAEQLPDPVKPQLSTSPALTEVKGVDELTSERVFQADGASVGTVQWGLIVPKRHARRAVTRALIKRQVRQLMRRHGHALAQGIWLVRLRAAFPSERYPSAKSDALRSAVREELEALIAPLAGSDRRAA
jgi:ribonuclease P protein component